jgi:phage minor structural protein
MKKQVKIAYFPSSAGKNKVLGSNGKSLDKYCIKCISDEDASTGNYICDLTFLIDDNILDLLQEEAILKVLMDYGYEIFRISKVTVGTRYVDVVARQITIADSLTLWLEDVRPTNLNGQAAAGWLLNNAEGTKEIQIVSDIDTVTTAYYQRMSLYKALHDSDNSFLNRWGGEVQRRGYTIYINKRIGTDRGFTIREGKNLTGFEGTSNIDNLVTRARGQGFNGILGNYIDSPLIGAYNRIYTSVIKYEDVKVKDEYSEDGYDTLEEAQTELDRRINEEFSKNDIDKIKASYTINFVQLEKTEEYKNYIVAERLFIGDNCRVYIPKLNVDIKVRAMSKKYDVLAQKTKEIKLSNYIEAKPLSIKQIAEKLETMDSTETILQLAKDNATSLIKGGLKNSHVIVKENEIIIGDTKDINTMTNVWRFNNGGLGHSKTGYYGDFGTAITQDGQIVADFITTGVLNANLIKTGVITGFNDNLTINLDTGEVIFEKGKLEGNNALIDITNGNIYTKANGNKALEFIRQTINFYDWEGTTRTAPVGTIYSARSGNDPNKPGLGIANNINSYFSIAYDESETTNVKKSYVVFDYYGVIGNPEPIAFYEGVKFWQNINLEGAKILGGELSSPDGQLGFYALNGGAYISGKTTVVGDFSVVGNKNCIQPTQKYGNRLFYSTEDTESYLTDTCHELMTVTKTEAGTFERVILIDSIVKECLNLEINYIVDIHKVGWGDFKIKEQTKDYFIVESDREDFTFKYTIKAKRKGYENLRLEKFYSEVI